MTRVVTRIPPSPTGRLHIGTARTALFNYLYSRQTGGTVLFRSEDTDRGRSTKEFEDEIVSGLEWLGLSWDSFSRQSERGERYSELLQKIIEEGKAYVSKEPAKDDPSREVEVVRLKNPGTTITFTDLVRGDITFDTTELGDFVIARSINDALYHFSVVVDDMDGGVTHVIRGEDHISNTPRQILIQEAIGADRPSYAHLPLILDEKRAKLSKRSGTAVAIADYQAEGFLPEGLVNYLALLGWNPGDDGEYLSIDDLITKFSIHGVHKGGASWDRTKLMSVNQHWMRKLSDKDFIERGNLTAPNQEMLMRLVPLMKERSQTFGEAQDMLSGELNCFFSAPTLDREALVAKEPADRPGITQMALESLSEAVNGLTEDVSIQEARDLLMPLADAEEAKGKGGRGGVLWPLRYALSGLQKSPDPFTLISILGKNEAISRIQTALDILGE